VLSPALINRMKGSKEIIPKKARNVVNENNKKKKRKNERMKSRRRYWQSRKHIINRKRENE
jgi:hypothetical protein